MGQKGRTSHKWGRYDPSQKKHTLKKRTVSYSGDSPLVGHVHDGMCDYIEGVNWWIARSLKSERQILRAFDNGNVACCLYERTGAIIELGHTGQQYLIAIQLIRTRHNWDLDITLSELGVYLEELWDGEDVDVDAYRYPETQPT